MRLSCRDRRSGAVGTEVVTSIAGIMAVTGVIVGGLFRERRGVVNVD